MRKFISCLLLMLSMGCSAQGMGISIPDKQTASPIHPLTPTAETFVALNENQRTEVLVELFNSGSYIAIWQIIFPDATANTNWQHIPFSIQGALLNNLNFFHAGYEQNFLHRFLRMKIKYPEIDWQRQMAEIITANPTYLHIFVANDDLLSELLTIYPEAQEEIRKDAWLSLVKERNLVKSLKILEQDK